MKTPRIIAFYLPQYHPTQDNDKWWGKGFTEWTNVGKAKPLFKGHYQPKIPADLGYYDLRLPESRTAQTELAKEAGIYGFCYYHYWFGNGKMELERPFQEVMSSGEPDFPFMICWANESWHKKFWNKDGKGSTKEILIKQTYPGEKDIIEHFNYLLPAFKDHRYIKINGKPLFMIYNPLQYKDRQKFIQKWNELAIENGLPGIEFICQIRDNITSEVCNELHAEGFAYINTMRLWEVFNRRLNLGKRIVNRIKRTIFKLPYTVDFKRYYQLLINKDDEKDYIIPTIVPNWDHTPRSGVSGTVLTNSTPDLLRKQMDLILNQADGKPIIFLKSWNEWGEGNYIEPDLKYGHGYLNAIKEAMNSRIP